MNVNFQSLFLFTDNDLALIAAQPDADLELLAALDSDAIPKLDDTEETNLLETRPFRLHCGCNLEKMLPILGSWWKKPDKLFHYAYSITIQCPRFAASYLVTRDMIWPAYAIALFKKT